MAIARMAEVDLNDDLTVLDAGPNTPPLHQNTTPAEYRQERERIEDNDVIATLREMDGAESVTWKIFRLGSADPSMNGWVADFPNEMFTIENVARSCGPGKYRVQGRNSANQYVAQRTLTIAGDAQVQRHNAPPVAAGTAVAASGQLSLDEYERRQELRDERKRKERMELLTILVPALSPIVAALIGNRGPDIATLVTALKPPPAPTMPEMMTALASLKSLAPEQTVDPVDRALKLFDIIQDRIPSGEGGAGWTDIVKELVRTLGPTVAPALMARVEAANQPRAVAALAPPAGVPNAPNGVATNAPPITGAENPDMLALLMWLRTQLTMALTKAAKGTDPVFVADRILDDVPDTVDARELLQFVAREDWWLQLCRFEPKCAQFPDWFRQMRDAMLDSESDVAGVAGTQGAPTLSSSAPAAPAMTVTGEGVQTKIDRPPAGPPSLTGK